MPYRKKSEKLLQWRKMERPSHKKPNSTRSHKGLSKILISLNIVDIILVTMLCIWQSHEQYDRTKERAEKSFLAMSESFSIFASGDIAAQQSSVSHWASFIERDRMSLDEALAYLTNVSNSSNMHLHLIQANTLRGWCINERRQVQEEQVPMLASLPTVSSHPASLARPIYKEVDYQRVADAFASILPSLLTESPESGEVYLSAPFHSYDTGAESMGFCAPVTIRNGDDDIRHIIIKLINKNELGVTWKVADSYRQASVALLDRYGNYILQGNDFEGTNFWDFIRAGSGISYFDIGQAQAKFEKRGSNLIHLRGADGKVRYYAGCPTGKNGNMTFVVGILQEDILKGSINYGLAIIVLVGMLGLFAMDGCYLLSMNSRLKESVTRAEQESQFKTEFLSSMSHDIRTPMNAIMGLTKIMRQNEGNALKQKECLDKIELSGRHLLMLINDVLDISKIESDGINLSPAPFSLPSIAKELRTLTEPQSQEKNIAVSFRLKDIPHEILIADELRLKQVFMNLLSNAIKYTPEGGRVSVEISESPMQAASPAQAASSQAEGGGHGTESGPNRKDGQNRVDEGSPTLLQREQEEERCMLRYVVRDNGLGMSPEFMKTMYQAFTREVDTRVNKIPGTGLGLAIVKQLVDMMGGRIDCQSEINKGTVFTVELELPVSHRSGQEEGSQEDIQEGFLRGALILVAEDNDINWEIENELLSYQGIRSERAENGSICVEKLSTAPAGTYAAILMDMQMPVMDGIAAAKVIRSLADPAKRRIPIVAVTANAFVDDVRTCLDAGMDAHVCKPVNIESVIKSLYAAIRNKSQQE